MFSAKVFINYFCIFAMLLLCARTAWAEIETEYKIQAGFLLNLTSYVYWPHSEKHERVICVRGSNPFGRFLDDLIQLRKTNEYGEQLSVRYLQIEEPLDGCDVSYVTHDAFVNSESKPEQPYTGVLSISNSPEFLAHGGLLQFKKDGRRVTMVIDLDNSKQAGINFSSELLQLAQIVGRGSL